MKTTAFAFASLLFVACATETAPGTMVECPGPDCPCTGAACFCGAGLSCGLTCSAVEGTLCQLDCNDGNVCTTECGMETCEVDCDAMSTCDVQAEGTETNVDCTTGAMCNVVATGDNANLDCESGAECTFDAGGADADVSCRSMSRCTATTGRDADARESYRRALRLAKTRSERDFLRMRIAALDGAPPSDGDQST